MVAHQDLPPICLNIRELRSPCPKLNVGSGSHPMDPACWYYHLSDSGDSLVLAKVEGRGLRQRSDPGASLQDAETMGDSASAGGLGSRPILEKPGCKFPWSLSPW